MKKIVSAAMVAAMAAGFATAEVKVGLNARVRPDLYSISEYTDDGDVDSYTVKKYAGLGKANGFSEAKDTFSVKGSTDYAGVVADVYFTSPEDSNSNGSVSFDSYYGWVNWGALKFTAGVYDSRYTNRGNYTATEQGILDEEFSKTMGLSTKNGIVSKNSLAAGKSTTGPAASQFGAKVVKKELAVNWLGDFGNVAQTAGGNLLSFLVDYTFQDVGGGSLLLKGGLVQNPTATIGGTTTYTYYSASDKTVKQTTKKKDYDEDAGDVVLSSVTTGAETWGNYDSYTDDDGSFLQECGYVFEAAWRKDDAVALDFVFKNPVNKAYGFGLYVTPLFIPNTKNVVLGFTYGTQDDVLKSAFAVDLRGQYNINSAATFALGAKYEYIKTEDEYKLKDSDDNDVKVDNGSGLQVAGEFSYKFNDIVTAALDLGYFNTDLTDEDDNDDDGSQVFTTSLRGKFSAGKNAAITTAVRFNKVLNTADGERDYTFDIPVVLRVKM